LEEVGGGIALVVGFAFGFESGELDEFVAGGLEIHFREGSFEIDLLDGGEEGGV
jgi:hypothetical protein